MDQSVKIEVEHERRGRWEVTTGKDVGGTKDHSNRAQNRKANADSELARACREGLGDRHRDRDARPDSLVCDDEPGVWREAQGASRSPSVRDPSS